MCEKGCPGTVRSRLRLWEQIQRKEGLRKGKCADVWGSRSEARNAGPWMPKKRANSYRDVWCGQVGKSNTSLESARKGAAGMTQCTGMRKGAPRPPFYKQNTSKSSLVWKDVLPVPGLDQQRQEVPGVR